jgi:hypothetical protein
MRIIVPLFAAFFLAGCGKKTEVSAPVTQAQSTVEPTANNQGTASTTPVVALSGVTNAVQAGPDLNQLHRAVLRWILSNRRPPKDFEDFAATTDYQIPPPPLGKKYALDKHMHVILLDQ